MEAEFQNENSAFAPTSKHSSSQFFCELHLKLEAPAPLFPWNSGWGGIGIRIRSRFEDLLLLTLTLDMSPNILETYCPLFKIELFITFTKGLLL